MARIRAFIAIEVPVGIKRLLREVQDEIRSGDGGGKVRASFVNAANIHLTLKFLGDIEDTGIDGISSGLRAASAAVKPFELTVGKAEIRSRRVLWMPVDGGDKLTGLVKAMEEELALLGYEKDERSFRGHLTLARIKTTGAAKHLEKIITDRDFTINAPFTASGLTLFKSKLTPEGAIYTVLREVNFPSTEETG